MHAEHLFVGERRSPTAVRLGVTWRDGKLSARTLHAALRQAGIDPATQQYCNLFADDGPLTPDKKALTFIQRAAASGLQVVALGSTVAGALLAVDIPHVALIHPAARGWIRKTERYQAHVRSVLLGQSKGPPVAGDNVYYVLDSLIDSLIDLVSELELKRAIRGPRSRLLSDEFLQRLRALADRADDLVSKHRNEQSRASDARARRRS